MSLHRRSHPVADAARAEAGVGDQSDACRNGTVGCPGPDAGVSEPPCSSCFFEGGDDGDA